MAGIFQTVVDWIVPSLRARFEREIRVALDREGVLEPGYWSAWLSENRKFLRVAAGTYRRMIEAALRASILKCAAESEGDWYSIELYELGPQRWILVVPFVCFKKQLGPALERELLMLPEYNSIPDDRGERQVVARVSAAEAIDGRLKRLIKSLIAAKTPININSLPCTIAELKNDDFYCFDDPKRSHQVSTLIFQSGDRTWDEFQERRPRDRKFSAEQAQNWGCTLQEIRGN
jgi:hypothetical protein